MQKYFLKIHQMNQSSRQKKEQPLLGLLEGKNQLWDFCLR